MAFDASSGQLAVVHRSETIHRFLVDGAMGLTTIKSVKIKKHWPQAVAFGQTAARGPELWSFGRDDGEMYANEPFSWYLGADSHTRSHVLDEGGRITTTKSTGVVM
jgi:hypothetical protein